MADAWVISTVWVISTALCFVLGFLMGLSYEKD